MIWKTLESIVSFYILFKAIKSFKNLQKLQSLLKNSPIKNVHEIKQLLKSKKPLQKMFVVIKGIAQSSSKSGQNDIISIIKATPLRTKQTPLNNFEKLNWHDIIKNNDWKRPRNFGRIQFDLKDIIKNQTMHVADCSNTNFSGGISEIFSDVIMYEDGNSTVVRFMKSVYNFVIDFMPFRFFLNKTKVGDELKYFGILEGQYLLSIGKVFKTEEGKIKMENPFYLTKQKGFIQKRLKRKMSYLYWLIFAIGILQFYFLYKLVMQFIQIYLKRKQQKKTHQEQQQRSQDEGQFVNCIICYSNIRTIALKPCRHYAFCQDCYQNIKDKTCPLCKANIDGIIKILKKRN